MLTDGPPVKASILIVDDEAGVRSALSGVLRDEGYQVDAVASGEACLDHVARQPMDLVILDIWLPGLDGLATLERLRERGVDAAVVMISGHGNIESAVRAIKMGAFDFVEKPLSLEKTVLVVANALRQRRLEAENRALRARIDRELTMVGESHAMRQLREQIAMAAPTNGRVLIYGENGTGKELVARAVHALSRRRSGPFVEVNCAAIPEELIESELFGHVRGAFTGAVADRRGKFEVGDGGTLFLDEIADMSLKTQAKVLRALQEQVVDRVGGASSVRVDVRVIAATNKDLPSEIRAGRFREDLFFRLNVVPIFVPPLRDRDEDVPLLAAHFIAQLSREHGRRPKRLEPGAMDALRRYHWPGNVRELRNVLERLMIMVPGDVIGVQHLSLPHAVPAASAGTGETGTTAALPLHDARERFERDYIVAVLAAQHGNMSRTAEVLGVERSNLYRKMRSYGLLPARKAGPDAGSPDAAWTGDRPEVED
jgi:two-component system nitrogen regulation response regulator NtrX